MFMIDELEQQVREADGQTIAKLQSAAEWMQEPLQEPDQMLADVFDRGDKLVVIGGSKSRKSFFVLQMILCMASGKPFLGWEVPKARRILHTQFEIQKHHFHRRLLRMSEALDILPSDLADRLQILNARGTGLTGKDAIESLRHHAEVVNPDLIMIDPLYKILDGDENSNGKDGMKGVLAMFDNLTEQTGAALSYVHHDAKGSAGDRQNTDRGAGGGILARDYDAAIVLTPHATEEDALIVEVVLRNYRGQEPFTIVWQEAESGGFCFVRRDDILPQKKTSRTPVQPPSLDTYLPSAFEVLSEEMEISTFKHEFKVKSGLSDARLKEFINWATAGGNPALLTREQRAQGVHRKWIRRRGM